MTWGVRMGHRYRTELVKQLPHMPAGLDGNPDPIVTSDRTAVINHVVAAILEIHTNDQTWLIGVDGIDGSGKSTFADELSASLVAHELTVVRSTIDSFHNPRSVRWERGRSSPLGFFLDSHDLDALCRELLEPFASATREYVVEVFNEPTDEVLNPTPRTAAPGDVLVFDGIFVQRPELAEFWDLVVFLDAQQRVNLSRLGHVMQDVPHDPAEIVAHVLEWDRRIDRYSSGMQYYLDLVDPKRSADIVIDNNDLARPVVTTDHRGDDTSTRQPSSVVQTAGPSEVLVDSASAEWMDWARELSALAKSGKYYNTDPAFIGDPYDAERYDAIDRIASKMLATSFGASLNAIELALGDDEGHITPKVDVRGALFDGDRVLLVQEKLDGLRWTLPGGWADVTDSPSSAVEREFSEETGLVVQADRLLAVFDRRAHNDPAALHGTFKMMFSVQRVSGEVLDETTETASPTFWPLSDLPELSTGRITELQLQRIYEVHSQFTSHAAYD